jgi:inorganic pyrophosphatase
MRPLAPEVARLLAELPPTPRVLVEYARGAVVKRRGDGSVDFVSPLPCPWAYGRVDEFESGDAEPLDALLLGAGHRRGASVELPVLAVVDFLDRGRLDPKLVCGPRGRLRRRDRIALVAFFRAYAVFKRVLAGARGQAGATRFRGLCRPGA